MTLIGSGDIFEKPKSFPSVENFENGIIFLSRTKEKLLWFQQLCIEIILLRLFRLIRLFSLIRIGRYSNALKNVLDAISDRKQELIFAIAISSTVLLISSTFMYLLEAEHQPEAFGSIIRSTWWAAAALTTVGYGDVYPITALGKVFAVISAFSSIGIVALPAGILAGSFREKFKKKKWIFLIGII